MTSLHSRPAMRASIAALLCYLFVISMWVPLATAERRWTNVKPITSIQDPAPYRDGELLVRFRPGVSQQGKDAILISHGARKKQQLRGESGVEKLELNAGRDARTVALQLLLDPQVEFVEPNFLIAKDDRSHCAVVKSTRSRI